MPYKNPEQRKSYQREYQKQYRAKNSDICAEYHKEYRKKNKKKIAEYSRNWRKRSGYKSKPNNAWRKKKYSSGAKFIESVKLFYGCQNPDCKWTGEFKAYCLDFHHIDRKAKLANVASLATASTKRIANEMCKCTILCAMCHRQETWGELDASKFRLCVVDSEGHCSK